MTSASDLHLIKYAADGTPQAVATVPSFTHPSFAELRALGFAPCSKQVYTETKKKLSEGTQEVKV